MIEALTPEQEKLMLAYRNEWLQVGYSTAPIDETACKEVLTEFYRLLGKAPPKFIVYDSPLACCRGLAKEAGTGSKKEAQEIYSAYYAQGWWSSWVAFYRFGEMIGVNYSAEDSRKLALWEKLTRACHWFFPFENYCALSQRPVILEVDQAGRIHGGIEYKDGTGVWEHHGIRVSREAIRVPGWVTIKKIEAETNAEVRRAYVEIYGVGKYLLDTSAKILSKDSYGVLYSKAGDLPMMAVRVVNATPEPDGTLSVDDVLKIFGKPAWWNAQRHEKTGLRYKEYFLVVHPEMRPLLDPLMNDGAILGEPQAATARNAVASTFGMTGEEYAPQFES